MAAAFDAHAAAAVLRITAGVVAGPRVGAMLPTGMTAQRDNRQETIINQDASIIMDAKTGVLSAGADPRVEAYAWAW